MRETVGKESGICPVCGEYINSYEAADIRDRYVYYPWTCKCGAEGEECYEMIYVDIIARQYDKEDL